MRRNFELSFIILVKDIFKKIYKTKISVFLMDVDIQKKHLSTLPNAKNHFERSYFQYRCQMHKISTSLIIMQNIVAAILLPFYFLILILPHRSNKSTNKTNCAVFFAEGFSDKIIPDILRKDFDEILIYKFTNDMYFTKYERRYLIKNIMKYWYSPYFIFKCMLKIAMYAAKIYKHSPRAIISYSEYSFTSSVLTEYCESLGIEHINVMHGEKLFNIRDSFVEYSRYYVWDEHYINLLTDLRADKSQFHIAIPNSVKILWDTKKEPIYDYTYYLGNETREEMLEISEMMQKINISKSRICVRYHPRCSNLNETKSIFGMFVIESPTAVPLSDSFTKCKYVVSLYSTILYQAYESKKEIIIDDMTNCKKYEKLKELRYIMLEKPHKKLSEEIILKYGQ